jgi:hypothetical protein
MTSTSSGDRALARSRREAWFSLGHWVAALVWTIGACVQLAPSFAPNAVTAPVHASRLFGVPVWVLVGVVAPWLIVHVVASLFAMFGMSDDDLDRPPG